MEDGVFCSVAGINVCTKDAESAMTGLFNEAYMDAYGMAISKSRTEHRLAKYRVAYLPMAISKQIIADGDQTEVLAYVTKMIAGKSDICINSVLLINGTHVLVNVDLHDSGGDIYLYAVNGNNEKILLRYKQFFKRFRCNKSEHTWKFYLVDAANPSYSSVTDASQSSPFVCAAMDIIAHRTDVLHFKGKLTNSMMPKVRTLICAFLWGLLYP
jgi:hypothetical protein